eukprot:jgi/Tetstr1/434156/TSEL_002480.t1
MLSMDLHDGFYAASIASEDRDYFTVNYRGKLYRLAGLPMGWSMSPYYFSSPTTAFIRHLRRPDYFAVTSQGVRRAKLSMGRRQALRSHFRGRNPDKGQWEPLQRLEHLGMEIDSRSERARFLFLSIKPAWFYLRKLHDMHRTKDPWSRRANMTH